MSDILASNADYFGEPLRRAMRAQMVELGIPPQFTDEIADIACHAANEAADTLIRIAFAHPDTRIGNSALGPAISVLSARLEVLLDALKHASAASGARMATATLEVRR